MSTRTCSGQGVMGVLTLLCAREHRSGSSAPHVLAQPPSLVPSLCAEITGQQGSRECQELLH